MRIGINGSRLLARHGGSVGALIDDVERTAADGLASWWVAQTSAVDALAALAAIGARGAGPGLELGTAVVPTFLRHPLAMAAAGWTAQSACPDRRVVLGIGLSHEPVVRERFGLPWHKPVRHMREYLTILSDVFTLGRVDVDGEIWSAHTEMALSSPPPSVMVAALGPQMLRLAGARTDGTILWMVGPRTIAAHIAPTITRAAEDAGRPAPRIVCSLPVCVTDDVDRVRELAAAVFAPYGELPSYAAMLEREGVSGPAEVCLIGDEARVGAMLDDLEEAGATDFAALELTTNAEEESRTRSLLAARARRT